MPNLNYITEQVNEAQEELHPVELVYKEDTGTVRRTIEPYEIKEETLNSGEKKTYLYGVDISPTVAPVNQHTKRFNVNKIIYIRIVKTKTYTPRY